MKNFARHIISRHTQPESNISPRVRGLFEPETAGAPFKGDPQDRWPSNTGAEQAGPAAFIGPDSMAEPDGQTNSSNPATMPQSRHSSTPDDRQDPGDPRSSDNTWRSPGLRNAGSLMLTGGPHESGEPRGSSDPSRGNNADPSQEAGADPTTSEARASLAGREKFSSDAGDRSLRQVADWRLQKGSFFRRGGQFPGDIPFRGGENSSEDTPFQGEGQPGEYADGRAFPAGKKDNRGMVLPAIYDGGKGDPAFSAGDGKLSHSDDSEQWGLRRGGPAHKSPGALRVPGFQGQAGELRGPQDLKEEPVIKVTIGRIEVKAIHPPTPPPEKRREAPKPRLSLEDFLNQRKK